MNNQLTKEQIALAALPAITQYIRGTNKTLAVEAFDFADVFLAESEKRAQPNPSETPKGSTVKESLTVQNPDAARLLSTPWGVERTESTNWIGPMRKDGVKVNKIVCFINRNGLNPEALARNDALADAIARLPELLKAKATPTHHVPLSVSRELHEAVLAFFGPEGTANDAERYTKAREALANATPDPAQEALKEIVKWCEWAKSEIRPQISADKILALALRGLKGGGE